MTIKNCFRKGLLVLATLATMASAQEHPTSNPTEVWVKGRKVDHSWRGGRVWVPTSELQPLLNIGSQMPTMDLLKSLEEKGGYLWTVTDGKFEARPDPSRYSQAAPSRQATAKANRADIDRQIGELTVAVNEPGKLFYAVREFTADTGFVRAFVAVQNDGPNPSDPAPGTRPERGLRSLQYGSSGRHQQLNRRLVFIVLPLSFVV